jgi:peptidoglycan L-alanyl-D-glutamate endopeptidase CwlK
MGYSFGAASKARLKELHPDLVKVLQRAIQLSEIDFTIIEGLRSKQRQAELYAQGRTKPGPKVTWTMNSNHMAKADGFGYAVDIYPYPVSQVLGKPAKDWEPLFDKIAKAMFAAAKEVGVRIRWGADWDADNLPRERGETDNPHFELRT